MSETRRKSNPARKVILKERSIVRFIPNMATMMALCIGLTGIHFAMMERYETAVTAIIIAGVFDILDGRLARILGAESEFGAEFDSLSDFVSFGVVPAVIVYMWGLHQWRGWGWAFCLFFVVCSGWRLARFNTHLRNPDTKTYQGYFMGVPAPMGASIGLLPLMIGFCLGLESPLPLIIYGFTFVLAGLLMVSSFPTFSTKALTFTRRMVFPILLGGGITVMALLNAPWETLSLLGLMYLASIPYSYYIFKKRYKSKSKEA